MIYLFCSVSFVSFNCILLYACHNQCCMRNNLSSDKSILLFIDNMRKLKVFSFMSKGLLNAICIRNERLKVHFFCSLFISEIGGTSSPANLMQNGFGVPRLSSKVRKREQRFVF